MSLAVAATLTPSVTVKVTVRCAELLVLPPLKVMARAMSVTWALVTPLASVTVSGLPLLPPLKLPTVVVVPEMVSVMLLPVTAMTWPTPRLMLATVSTSLAESPPDSVARSDPPPSPAPLAALSASAMVMPLSTTCAACPTI